MGSVVTSHTLERAGKDLLLLADLLEGSGNVVRESLEFVSDIGKVTLDLVMVLLGLVHMCSPLLTITGVLVDLELVSNSLYLEHPLVSTN